MLASMFRNLRLRAAAKRYAAKLPPQIHTDYGTSDTYTQAQIAKSAARAGLPADMVALGYAAFLTEAAFNAIPNRPAWVEYQTLRALITRYTPPRDCADDATAPEHHYGASGGFS
jgi:hypothetical protein